MDLHFSEQIQKMGEKTRRRLIMFEYHVGGW
jgi:hypothetical protein